LGNAFAQAEYVGAQDGTRDGPGCGGSEDAAESPRPASRVATLAEERLPARRILFGLAKRARLLLIHSFMVRREVCGTSTKRMPTRPEESCHTTSPDRRTEDFSPGKLN
jgi:hypothetical protein